MRIDSPRYDETTGDLRANLVKEKLLRFIHSLDAVLIHLGLACKEASQSLQLGYLDQELVEKVETYVGEAET